MSNKASLPTVTGLRSYQASMIAAKYIETSDWDLVRAFAISENLFDASRQATAKRYISQIHMILGSLNEQQLQIVASGTESDRLALLWFGFCKSFPLVGMFASEVISEKFRNRSYSLVSEDLWEFLSNKSVDYESLGSMSDAVRKKVKSVIFYNLRDAGYLNGMGEILAANLSSFAKDSIGYENLMLYPGEEA